MRKQYIKPVLETHRVGLGSLMTDVVTMSGESTVVDNVGAKSRDDDEEIYESEGGNYGDLW